MTRCTVAIPVYNRPVLVRAALESALAQDLEGLEVLVIDNCSTDDTWDVLNRYADPRLRLVRNGANVGLFGNLNRCLELARGEYLRILCSDDRLVPDCLAREVSVMEQQPQVALLSTRASRVNETYTPVGAFAEYLSPGLYHGPDSIAELLYLLARYSDNPLNYPSGILLRRRAAESAGRFTDEFASVGDVDYWLRVLEHGDLAICPHAGCEVMIHAGQAGAANLFYSGRIIEEWRALAQRWKGQLCRRDLYDATLRQIAACALWAAVYCLRHRRGDGARLYWRMATAQAPSGWSLGWAVVRLGWAKASRRLGKRDPLMRPYAPLPPDPRVRLASRGSGA